MEVTFTRTRQSLGSQLREALDGMTQKGSVREWEVSALEDGRLCYRIVDYWGREGRLTPGDTMDWLNCYGHDIRFGKS